MNTSKFCTKCGAELDSGQRFCTKCGNGIAAGEPAGQAHTETAQRSSAGQTTPTAPVYAVDPRYSDAAFAAADAGRPKSKKPVVLAVVIALLAAAAIVAVLFGTGVLHPSDGNAPEPPAEQAASNDEESNDDKAQEEPSGDGAEGEEAAEKREPAPEPAASTGLELSNADDYYRVNLCLSNFSEIGTFMNGYDASNPSSDQVFLFAFLHAMLNSTTAVESGRWYIDGTPFNYRVSLATLQKYSNLFLKIPLEAHMLPSVVRLDGDQVYISGDGAAPEGIALAQSITSLGGNRYEVEFDVYGGIYDDRTYTVTDQEYYRMTPDQLKRRFSQSYPTAYGTAVIETGYDNETAPFKVLLYRETLV